MSHITIKQPDGKWCIWSTVVDDFIVVDATREEIVEYRLEGERERVERKLDEIEEQGGDWYVPPTSYEELVERRELVHGEE